MTDWNAPPDGESLEEMARVREQERAQEEHDRYVDDILWRKASGFFDRDGRPFTRIPVGAIGGPPEK